MMSSSSSSRLRRPNLANRSLCGGIAPASAGPAGQPTAASLADFTRQSHRRLLQRDDAAALSDDEPENDGGRHAGGDTSGTAGGDGDANGGKKKDDPSMDQCVILLEPALQRFREGCTKRDKARAKKAKRKKGNDAEEGDSGEEEEDEVPPQLLRLARFFQYRWVPVKRALLRPPPSLPSGASDGNAPDVEVSVHYRLRLAKACWKKGMVAAAEYEALKGSFERGEKRKGPDDDAGDSAKRCKSGNFGGEGNLTERARLALMRLPTEAIQPEHSVAAWRHAKEMVLECCKHWETSKAEEKMLEGEDALDVLTPSQVADWTLTSWTALLLSRGVDSFALPAGHHHSHGHNPVTSVERYLAALLSDQSNTNNPTLALARAVASRIDELLSPDNIDSLNGVHLYSLGRLLAAFRSREDAEGHIVKSIVRCSSVGGTRGLEQLSKLLAVYACCLSATAANDHSVSRGLHGRKTMTEMEERLRGRLEHAEICSKDGNEERPDLSGAKSFLDTVLCATAHLIKGTGSCDAKV